MVSLGTKEKKVSKKCLNKSCIARTLIRQKQFKCMNLLATSFWCLVLLSVGTKENTVVCVPASELCMLTLNEILPDCGLETDAACSVFLPSFTYTPDVVPFIQPAEWRDEGTFRSNSSSEGLHLFEGLLLLWHNVSVMDSFLFSRVRSSS